jgi:hypothetical protein
MTYSVLPAVPQEIHFDRWSFIKRPLPVSAKFDGHEFQSNGLGYEDYNRCHLQHKGNGDRRFSTPVWALNDALLRRVLVEFLERRAYTGTPERENLQPCSLKERLIRIEQKLRQRRLQNLTTIDRLCHKYVELRKADPHSPELKMLTVQIENVDTRLRIADGNEVATVAAIVYLYHRQGLDSVGVANELGIKAPMVRTILYRLQRTASALGYPKPERLTPQIHAAKRQRRTKRIGLHGPSQTEPALCQKPLR